MTRSLAYVFAAFVLSTVANIAFQVADIVFTDRDPHRSEGPLESLPSIAVVGVAALAVALAAGFVLIRDPGRARVGAIVFGALSLVTLPLFWSGAPATFGATAVWLAGRPQSGAPRAFGVIGLVVAILVVVAVFAGGVSQFVTQ
ncbi:hypothetical protein [Dactylosporangium sp. NPDC051541]|uniref:hypothetical protein n=1 Tax=Dactylosporangium sp. NPDC051541 TaxID=3363977 RepID=UPI0037B61CA1